ncbi:MAG: hypothetical protein ACU0E9_02475 [Limimaricola soesokkakensis]|uniref:hypothetical protein n=1 Tax=Limimaricola soesokkakensis TaxID=1343159 RepID=UPI004059A93C
MLVSPGDPRSDQSRPRHPRFDADDTGSHFVEATVETPPSPREIGQPRLGVQKRTGIEFDLRRDMRINFEIGRLQIASNSIPDFLFIFPQRVTPFGRGAILDPGGAVIARQRHTEGQR